MDAIEQLLEAAGWALLTLTDSHIMIQRDDGLMVEGYVRSDGRACLWVGDECRVLVGKTFGHAVAAAGCCVRKAKGEKARVAGNALRARGVVLIRTEPSLTRSIEPEPHQPGWASVWAPCQGDASTTTPRLAMRGEIF